MDWIGGMGEGQKTPPSSIGAWKDGCGWVGAQVGGGLNVETG